MTYDEFLDELVSLVGDIRLNERAVFQMFKDGYSFEEVARVIKGMN